jgi:2-dehydro-3-deoxyphosphogluconate aldolase/(4S)-4-hydroxy-2-oxoglutarate aldolase
VSGLLDVLRATRILAILRAAGTGSFAQVSATLVRAGIKCLEFPLTTPSALSAISAARRSLPAGVLVGAGTVLGRAAAEDALRAGASFLVTPTVELDVIEAGAAAGAHVIAGGWTPTEILTAWRAGAAAVKVFPAPVGGPRYIRDVLVPLGDIPLVATGGMPSRRSRPTWTRVQWRSAWGPPLVGKLAGDVDLGALHARAEAAATAARGAHG